MLYIMPQLVQVSDRPLHVLVNRLVGVTLDVRLWMGDMHMALIPAHWHSPPSNYRPWLGPDVTKLIHEDRMMLCYKRLFSFCLSPHSKARRCGDAMALWVKASSSTRPNTRWRSTARRCRRRRSACRTLTTRTPPVTWVLRSFVCVCVDGKDGWSHCTA